MKKWSLLLVIALAIGFFPYIIESADLKFKGYMFGEYYYVLDHNSGEIDDGGIKGRNGFWFRRIYFTTDMKISDNWKGRLRFEMNSPGKLPFDSSDKLQAVVKDAYLSYATGNQELMFGIVSTPTFGHNIEKIWGYRHLEKTPLDLMRLAPSRDFGIGAKGHLDEKKTINYYVLFANGSSNKGETNKGKRVYGSLAFKLVKGLTLEAYGDYEDAGHDVSYYLFQGFGGYEGNWGRIGALFARRHFKQEVKGGSDDEYDYDIISGFVVINAAKDVDIIARYDRMFGAGFESNFKGAGIDYIPFAKNPGAPFNLVIGGISWQAGKNVWLIPNIKYVFYGDPDIGEKPSEDVYANMTIWFKF